MELCSLSGRFRGHKGVQMHPPSAASNVFCVNNCTSPSNMIVEQWNAATTTKHS